MSEHTRMPRAVAMLAAEELRATLAPACERIEIAGSLRRGAAHVHDIELVAIAKTETVNTDLFGETSAEISLLEPLLARLQDTGALAPRVLPKGGHVWGPRTKYAAYYGIPVDLFIVAPPAQWGIIMLLRTGPADWSKKLVTSILQGGYCPYPLRFHDGQLRNELSLAAIDCPDEADVFEALDLQYLPPEERGRSPLARLQPTQQPGEPHHGATAVPAQL